MTTPVLVTVELAGTSGLPTDVYVNDFAFNAADTDDATLDGIMDSLESFYNDVHSSGGNPLAAYLSKDISRSGNACSMRCYDLTGHLDGSAHGSPVRTRGWTLEAAASGGQFPTECAVVLSSYADGWASQPETAINPSPPPATIRPQARYRGRIYLGPVSAATSGNAAVAPVRPDNTTFLNAVHYGLIAFMDERGEDFGVWSRADEVIRLVAPDGVWKIDDAYDTQRRRGTPPTTRSTQWP